MSWTNPPKSRSLACNGDVLRACRQRRGWTQERAADISGYSVRLIRKAEAGQPIHPDTIEILAETYTTDAYPVHPEDLICDTRALARTLLHDYRSKERQVVAHTQNLLSEKMTCWVAGNPDDVPFAGDFEGIDGFDRFWAGLFVSLDTRTRTFGKPFDNSATAITEIQYCRRTGEVIAIEKTNALRVWKSDGRYGGTIWKARPGERPFAFAVSPNGRRLIIEVRSPQGNFLEFFDRENKRTMRRLPCDDIAGMVFSPDGEQLACNDERTIRIIEIRSGKSVHSLRGSSSGINDIAFSPDGQRVAGVSDDRKLYVWDRQSGSLEWSVTAHRIKAEQVEFSPDGETILTTGKDRMLRFWRWRLRRMLMEMPLQAAASGMLRISPDGRQILVGHTLQLYDARSRANRQSRVHKQNSRPGQTGTRRKQSTQKDNSVRRVIRPSGGLHLDVDKAGRVILSQQPTATSTWRLTVIDRDKGIVTLQHHGSGAAHDKGSFLDVDDNRGITLLASKRVAGIYWEIKRLKNGNVRLYNVAIRKYLCIDKSKKSLVFGKNETQAAEWTIESSIHER